MRECVTRFFGGRPGLSDCSELQLRYSTGLYTGFAFKPSHPGEWHQKSIYSVKSILLRFILKRQVIYHSSLRILIFLNSETCPNRFLDYLFKTLSIADKFSESHADFESAWGWQYTAKTP